MNILLKSITLTSFLFFSGDVSTTKLASCCTGAGGRCTGSANCTACSNCSRCGHCSSGGTCGVCEGRTRTAPSRTYNTTTPLYSTPSTSRPATYDPEKVSNLKMVVSSLEINLRSGPGLEFPILMTLSLGDQVNYIGKKGDWIYVQTESWKKGYVHYKSVKFVE